MNDFVERLGWVLLHTLWQFAFVALLAGVIVRTMRRSLATARYVVLVGAMALMIVAPLATWWMLPSNATDSQASREVSAPGPVMSGDASPGADAVRFAEHPVEYGRDSESGTSAADVGWDSIPTRIGGNTTVGMESQPTNVTPEIAWSERAKAVLRPWLSWIVVAWSIGVLACSLRPLLGWHSLRRLKSVGVSPVSEDVLAAMQRASERLQWRRAVNVMQSALAQVPVVVGYFKPVILLPVSLLTSLPAEQLEAILAHELAHVRRHDFLVNLLQTLVETLGFYHPAVWWLSHRMRVEREHCCDDLVVNWLGNRIDYGRALVAIEELRGRSTLLALGAADGSLLARVRRILGVTPDRAAIRPSDRWPAAFVTLGCLLLLAIGTFVSSQAENEKAVTEHDHKASVAQVVATVNGVEILDMELLERYGEDLKRLRATTTPEQFREQCDRLVARDLTKRIEQELLAQEAKSKLTTEEEKQLQSWVEQEFTERVETLRIELKAANEQELDKLLQAMGTSLKSVKTQWLNRLLAQQCLAKHLEEKSAEKPEDVIRKLWNKAVITRKFPEPKLPIRTGVEQGLLEKWSSDGRGSHAPALIPTAGLPNSDEATNPTNNANGDQRSGDTRRARDGEDANDDPIAATVNGIEILEAEVLEPFGEQLAKLRAKASREEYHKARQELIEQHLQRAIERQLLVQESNRTISSDVREQIDQSAERRFDDIVAYMKKDLKLSTLKDLKQHLQSRGSSLAIVKANIFDEFHSSQFLARKYQNGGREQGGDFIDELWKQAEIKTAYNFAKGRGISDELRDLPNQRIRDELLKQTAGAFVDQPLGDVLIFWSDFHNIVIRPDVAALPNWKALAETPITLENCDDLAVVLGLMLEPLRLTYRVENGELLITTPTELQRRGEKLPASVTATLEGLEKKYPETKWSTLARGYVTKEDAEQSLPGLVKALSDDGVATRLWAAKMIGQLGEFSKPTIPDLAKLTLDGDDKLRRLAYINLSKLGTHAPEALKPVMDGLRRCDSEATVGLVTMPVTKESFEQLIEVFDDPKSADMRGAIASRLFRFGDQAVPVLKNALSDSERQVRFGASRSLKQLRVEHDDPANEPLSEKRSPQPKNKPSDDSKSDSTNDKPGDLRSNPAAGSGDARRAQPVGLEFLKLYPKLHGLSLDMTEPQFLEIVKQQELKTRKTVEAQKVAHHIGLGDGHTLIVMFDKDAKCSGIQRVRGEAAAKVPSAEVKSNAEQQPNRAAELPETELLRKLVRGGKIDTRTINASITLVAAHGAQDMEFARLVLADFEMSCEGGDRTAQSRRHLLAVLTDIFEAWSSQGWRSQLSRFNPDDLPQSIPPQVDAKLGREMLARVIQHGYATDRSEIANVSLAVRQLHHPAGREFLRDVLREPGSKSDPLAPNNPPKTVPQQQPQTTPAPKSKSETPTASRWKDNTGGGWTDAKFVAAVGLAELGEAEGIDWLLARAQPNEFGIDASLWSFPHLRDPRGSLRESSRLSLADLFGLPAQATETELADWWRNNRTKFTARPATLKLRAGRGSPDPALTPTAGLPNANEDTKSANNVNGDLRSNPTAGPGDTLPAQYVAAFGNGSTLELVGITRNLAKSRTGWKPNGEPIGDVPEWPRSAQLRGHSQNSLENSLLEGDGKPDDDAFDLLLRFENVKSQPSLQLQFPSSYYLYITEHLEKPHLLRVPCRLDKTREPSNVRIGLTDEPWGIPQQVSPSGELINRLDKSSPYWSSYQKIKLDARPTPGEPNDVQFVLQWPYGEFAVETRVVGTNGKGTWVDGSKKSGSKLHFVHSFGEAPPKYDGNAVMIYQLRREAVARFEYRLRPYRHWLTFENVSLQPGLNSDVKVKVEFLPDEKPRVERGTPAPAPTAGLPKSNKETNPPNKANVDLRSNPAAGSGDPRPAQLLRIVSLKATDRPRELADVLKEVCRQAEVEFEIDDAELQKDRYLQSMPMIVDEEGIRGPLGFVLSQMLNPVLAFEFVDQKLRVSTRRKLKGNRFEADHIDLAKLAETAGPALTSLRLCSTRATDDDLRHLAKFPKLERLNLTTTAISDAGMEHVARLESLTKLELGDFVTDTGLKTLTASRSIRTLALIHSPITDAAAESLVRMPALESLTIQWANFGDAGVKRLAAADRLKHLGLYVRTITDDGAAALASCRKLETFMLLGQRMTVGCLKPLETMRSLRELEIGFPNVTTADVKPLRAALPSTKIRQTEITPNDPRSADGHVFDAETGRILETFSTQFGRPDPVTGETQWEPLRADHLSQSVTGRFGVSNLQPFRKFRLIADGYEPVEITSLLLDGDDPRNHELNIKMRRVKNAALLRTLRKPALLLPDHWIVQAVAFDHEGKELVTASNQSFITIRRWDVVGRKLVSEIKLQGDKHGRAVRDGTLMFSGDRRRVVAATDEYVGIWDATTGKLLKQLPFPTKEGIYTCAIDMLDGTPDLSVIVGHRALPGRLTLSFDAHLIVWDGLSGNVLQTVIDKGATDLKALDLSTDGKRLVTTNGGGAKIWETSTGQLLRSIPNDNTGRKHSEPDVSSQATSHVWSVQFSPDGQQLAMGDILGVKLLDATSGKLLQQLEGPYRYSSSGSPGLVFSKDGQWLARLGTQEKVFVNGDKHRYVVPIWSTRTGARLFELHTEANDAAFSDDGQRLAVVFSDMQQALSVWTLSGDAAQVEQTAGPGPHSRQDRVEENGHYVGKTAAEYIDKFQPTWGDAKLGLQYGIALTKPERQVRGRDGVPTYERGERVSLVVFFRNASDKPIKFDTAPDFFGNTPKVLNAKGEPIAFENVPLLGHIPHYHEQLAPGEALGPFYLNFGLGENPRPGQQHWHPYWKSPVVGKYTLTHSISINVNDQKDGDPSKREQIASGTIEFEVADNGNSAKRNPRD